MRRSTMKRSTRQRSARQRRTRDERDEQGITTAEYAVGTAAGAGLAGVLYTLVTGGFGDRMLRSMYQHVMGMLGIG